MYLVTLREFDAIVLLALPSQSNSPADAYDKRLEASAEIVTEFLLSLTARRCLQPLHSCQLSFLGSIFVVLTVRGKFTR
jgi:hypothetical protein